MKLLSTLLMATLLSTATAYADNHQTITEVSLTGTQMVALDNEQGESYRILLSQPLATIEPNQPLIIVLDGDTLFPVGLRHLYLKSFEQQNHYGNAQVVTPVLIGIGYPDTKLFSPRRSTDYAPVSDDNLQKFIADRVLGLDTKGNHKLKDSPNISLVGHSFGALFALHTYANCAINCPYQHLYIASPSLWWRDGRVFDELDGWLAHQKNPPTINLSVGELEQTADDNDTPERNAMLLQRNMVGNTKKLSQILTSHHIAHTLTIFPNSTHHTTAELALKRAINQGFIRQ